MASILDRFAAGAARLAHAFNTFNNEEDRLDTRRFDQYGASYGIRPDRRRVSSANDRSIITSVITRMGVDAASIDIRHVKVDENKRYLEDVNDGLNNCLTVEANIDQAARAFKQDIAMSVLERGAAAIVPVDTSINPAVSGAYDISTMRVGEIIAWYARHVRVKLWNDRKGRFEEVTVPKTTTAIVENPFYSVMNEPSSTLQRLIRKLNILDAVDEASGSGKLDLIIQLPYVIKSQARKEEAEKRAKDIEMQLKGSRYGIAYTDGTEHITQLNRPAENNLLAQIKYLTDMLYAQLGLTEDIFSGKADDKEMLNYYTRTIEPILESITEAMARTFLTKTARTQGHTIAYFRDPFKLVAVKDLAEIADKFRRNEILSSNDFRAIIGYRPSTDAKADSLSNPNMPQPPEAAPAQEQFPEPADPDEAEEFDSFPISKLLG